MQIPEFSKQSKKDLMQPIEKPDFDVDGDTLILNPQKPGRKIPNINL